MIPASTAATRISGPGGLGSASAATPPAAAPATAVSSRARRDRMSPSDRRQRTVVKGEVPRMLDPYDETIASNSARVRGAGCGVQPSPMIGVTEQV